MERENDYFLKIIRELSTAKPLTLEEKKDLFVNYVKEACNRFKISIPSINFETIEHFSQGEDGHFHVDECKICVDEAKLKFLKIEKIKELAYHEVTHAFKGGHDKDFWSKMQEGMNGY